MLPLFQQQLCSLPVQAVATLLGVWALWLYDQQPKKIVPVTEGQRSMAVLVGSKQLAHIHGDDALGHVTVVLLSLPEGDDNLAADTRHRLNALELGQVVEAQSRGQRLVVAWARSPSQARMDFIGEIVHDYGWRLWRGARRVSGQCVGPGYSSTSRRNLAGSQFSSWRPRGTTQSRACSVATLLVH